MQQPSPGAPDNASNFDGLRLVAALIVIFGHEFSIRGIEQPMLLGSHVASLGVKIFFAVSGYLVAQSLERDPDAGRFLLRRGLRILPGMFVCVLATVLVLGPLFSELSLADYARAPGTWAYLWNLGFGFVEFMPRLFAGNPLPTAVNGSLWSLPAEAAMYLLLLLAALTARAEPKRWRLVMALMFAAAVGDIYVFGVMGWDEVLVYGTRLTAFCVVASFFCAGSLLWLARGDLPLRLDYAAAALLASILAQGTLAFPIVEPLALTYAALAVCVRRAPVLSRAAQHGDFSYGLYLYAYPVQQAVQHSFGAALSFPAALALSLAVTAACAAFSWHCVEKQFLRFKPVRPSAASAPAAGARPAPAAPSRRAAPAQNAAAR